MNRFLLRTYDDPERERIESVFALACSEYPYTLAHSIKGIVRELSQEHYSKAMNYTLDFFETAAQYISILFFAMLKRHALATGTTDETLVKVICRIDDKRPLSFGDWCNDLLAPLAVAASRTLADDPLCTSLSRVIRPRHNIFLGGKNDPSIVQIRNEYKGHSTTLSEEIYKGVVYTMEPRLIELLEALTPLSRARYFAASTDGNLFDLRGDTPKACPQAPAIPAGHYRIFFGNELFLDLFPLLFCDEKGYVYLFQSLINEEISYISTNESAVRKVNDRFNEEFDTCMQEILPSFDISNTLNWDEWVSYLHTESSKYIRRIYNEKKYNKELFVEREQLTAEFRAFLDGEELFFPMLGDAGQGKTNQLCHWTERMMQENEAVAIFAGSEFSTIRLEDKLRKIFKASPRKPVEKLIEALHRCAVERDRKVVVFIDAINECLSYPGSETEGNGPVDLYNQIFELFGRNGYTHFRILFTCRTYTWKNLIHPLISRQPRELFHLSTEDRDTSVRGFTEQELQRAYTIYGELYQMKTPYGNLTRGSIIRLRDPLVLKIACTNYLGRTLPERMRDYSSLSLFHKMLGDISSSYAGNRQLEILLEMAGYVLNNYEQGIPVDSISFEELRRAGNGPLAKLSRLILKDDGTSVAYGELLNKPERPVLRFVENEQQDNDGKIQFIYERFLEYLLALVYYRRESADNGQSGIATERIVATLEKAHLNELFLGAMRNVLIMDYVHTGRSDTIVDLAAHHRDNYGASVVINDTLNTLVGENYEDEIFSLATDLLHVSPDCTTAEVTEFNAVSKAIQGSKATEQTIARHRELSGILAPMLHLRQLASVTLLNGIFLTDYYNDAVYTHDPFDLLWTLLADPVTEVRNDACMFAYYVSNKRETRNKTPLRENLSRQIIRKMYDEINRTALLVIPLSRTRRTRIITFLEIATRINVLLIIDALLSGDPERRRQVEGMLGETVSVFRHLTGNYRLIRLLMPFFSMVLRRQITFQSAYVNNVTEYGSFWKEDVIPAQAGINGWGRSDLHEIMGAIFNYSRFYSKGLPVPDFRRFIPKVLAAYRTGDSFSYFALERLLIINGICDPTLIIPITDALSSPEYRQTEWYDYSQMSMIYVLYRLGLDAGNYPEQLWVTLEQWCADWTRRCRGYFRARNSHKANPMQLYKRNVMTWYAAVFGTRHPGCTPDEIRLGIPLFYELLDEAIDRRDKELLVHLIENISELVSDSGHVALSLELLKYILRRIDSREMIAEFDERADLRYPATGEKLVSLIGKLLATAKNHSPKQVDDFLKKELVGLKFPGIGQFREDILNYNPGGETLSDLFTHKFGNFLIWSLIYEEAVDKFAYEAMCAAVDAPNCIQWFDRVVRILFRHLFGVKI